MKPRISMITLGVSDLAFPAELASRWMPGLFPEKGASATVQGAR